MKAGWSGLVLGPALSACVVMEPTPNERDSGPHLAAEVRPATPDAGDAGSDASEAGDVAVEVGPADAAKDCSSCTQFEMCGDPSGQCAKVSCINGSYPPYACMGLGPRVCGCDGVQYPNECMANSHGTDFDTRPGACAAPDPSLFTCGTSYCKRGEEYCEGLYGDWSDGLLSCRPKPAACTKLDCACAKSAPCSHPSFDAYKCTDDGKSDVFVACTI